MKLALVHATLQWYFAVFMLQAGVVCTLSF